MQVQMFASGKCYNVGFSLAKTGLGDVLQKLWETEQLDTQNYHSSYKINTANIIGDHSNHSNSKSYTQFE